MTDSNVIYPESWAHLRQSPSARWELLQIASDVSKWNSSRSPIRKKGTDSIIGFLIDDYRIDEDVAGLIGQLIFSDEFRELDAFAQEFLLFVARQRLTDKHLSYFHESTAPESLIDCAKALTQKLKTRGVPRFRETRPEP